MKVWGTQSRFNSLFSCQFFSKTSLLKIISCQSSHISVYSEVRIKHLQTIIHCILQVLSFSLGKITANLFHISKIFPLDGSAPHSCFLFLSACIALAFINPIISSSLMTPLWLHISWDCGCLREMYLTASNVIYPPFIIIVKLSTSIFIMIYSLWMRQSFSPKAWLTIDYYMYHIVYMLMNILLIKGYTFYQFVIQLQNSIEN